MKLLCECGHRQVFHMGPTGPCRITLALTHPTMPGERCPCSGFVASFAVAPEFDRNDLA